MSAFKDALLSEHDLLNIRRIRKVSKDDVHLLGDLSRRTSLRGALGHQLIHRGARAVVDDQRKTRLQDVASDGLAHQAEADIANFEHEDSFRKRLMRGLYQPGRNWHAK